MNMITIDGVVSQDNLLTNFEWLTLIDEAKTTRNYAEELTQRVQDAFPGATVNIETTTDGGSVHSWSVNGESDHDMIADLQQIDEKLFRDTDVWVAEQSEKVLWSTLVVLGGDYSLEPVDAETAREGLRELKEEGFMTGLFFKPLPGQENDDASTWGPDCDDIDWTGFPAAPSTPVTS